jgi:hypothetical protein
VGVRIGNHARTRVKPDGAPASGGPASLTAVLLVTFLGSVSGGVFWTGIFFVTLRHYAFSESKNLALALGMGALYALVAYRASAIYALFDAPPRRVLALALVAWGIAAALPVAVPDSEWPLWIGALAGAAISGLVWPLVESYLGARRHGEDLRHTLGWFNVVWTLATALPLLVMPLLTGVHVLAPLLLCGVMNLFAVVSLAPLPPAPPPSEPKAAALAVGAEYSLLLRSASVLLPLSYLMSSTLSPVLPHRLSSLGPSVVPASILAATWMLARWATLAAMARLSFWHGRWGALLAAGAALTGGLAVVLLSSSIAGIVLGLALFGTGMGLTYCATLYYSLTVGHGAVDASGGFEALVGLGYVLGPIVGLVGQATASGAGASLVTVILTLICALAGAVLALRPYRAALRVRSAR